MQRNGVWEQPRWIQIAGEYPVVALVEVDLHESTSPEAIARDQRRDVKAAWKAGFRTVEAIAEEVILCPWVVWRRLKELRINRPLPVKAKKEGPVSGEVKDYCVKMLSNGPMTAREIAAGCSYKYNSINSALRNSPGVFQKVRHQKGMPVRLQAPLFELVPEASRRKSLNKTPLGV